MQDNGTSVTIYIFFGLIVAIIAVFIIFSIMLKVSKKRDNKLKGHRSKSIFKRNILYKMYKKYKRAKQKKMKYVTKDKLNRTK